jgi:hypothetical protein
MKRNLRRGKKEKVIWNYGVGTSSIEQELLGDGFIHAYIPEGVDKGITESFQNKSNLLRNTYIQNYIPLTLYPRDASATPSGIKREWYVCMFSIIIEPVRSRGG